MGSRLGPLRLSPFYFISQGIQTQYRPIASRGAEGAQAPPGLGRSVTPISTRGVYSPQPVLRAPLDFQTLRRPCNSIYILLVYTLYEWYVLLLGPDVQWLTIAIIFELT